DPSNDSDPVLRFDDSTVRRLYDSTIKRFDNSPIRQFTDSTTKRLDSSPILKLDDQPTTNNGSSVDGGRWTGSVHGPWLIRWTIEIRSNGSTIPQFDSNTIRQFDDQPATYDGSSVVCGRWSVDWFGPRLIRRMTVIRSYDSTVRQCTDSTVRQHNDSRSNDQTTQPSSYFRVN